MFEQQTLLLATFKLLPLNWFTHELECKLRHALRQVGTHLLNSSQHLWMLREIIFILNDEVAISAYIGLLQMLPSTLAEVQI